MNFAGEQSIMSALLSDAGKYSYCAVCVIAMKELYDNVWDKAFNEHCLDVILIHLKLPKSVSCHIIYHIIIITQCCTKSYTA